MLRGLQTQLSAAGSSAPDVARRLDTDHRVVLDEIVRNGIAVSSVTHQARIHYFDKLIAASVHAVRTDDERQQRYGY